MHIIAALTFSTFRIGFVLLAFGILVAVQMFKFLEGKHLPLL